MGALLSRIIRRSAGKSAPNLSVVVVCHNMRRELPRTLHSLSAAYQRNVRREDYEIVLVDNGSRQPWSTLDFAWIDANISVVSVRGASVSPAPAVNIGLERARGQIVGVFIDGARMATPGLLDHCRRATQIFPRPVVAAIGFHLGHEGQMTSVQKGYTPDVEDGLLGSINWPSDGYRLFEISVFNYSCAKGWFSPMAESNALFLPATLWAELGGYDEAFRSAGGGLVNLDTYERAVSLPGAQSVVVLGEGTFHQVHGGIASNATGSRWPEWHEEYRRIRGRDYRVPAVSSTFFGTMPVPALRHLCLGARGT